MAQRVLWRDMYDKVKEFKEEHGRWPENINAGEEELKLYGWCNKQRLLNKNGVDYPNEYIYWLNKIRFDWRVRNPADEKLWLENYEALIEFLLINKNLPNHGRERKMYYWYNYNLKQMDFWGPSDCRLPLMQKLMDTVVGLKLSKNNLQNIQKVTKQY